jgi:hypothetical protein
MTQKKASSKVIVQAKAKPTLKAKAPARAAPNAPTVGTARDRQLAGKAKSR